MSDNDTVKLFKVKTFFFLHFSSLQLNFHATLVTFHCDGLSFKTLPNHFLRPLYRNKWKLLLQDEYMKTSKIILYVCPLVLLTVLTPAAFNPKTTLCWCADDGMLP